MLAERAFRGPITLAGPVVRLVPLTEADAGPLARVATDPEIFRYLRYNPAGSVDRMREHIRSLLERAALGTDLPFTMVAAEDGRPLGMTRYLEIDRENECVEVGGTWTTPGLWGTAVNPASKRLLLGHAFEVEGVRRVQIKTDERNLRSQRAIEKLGAVREGVLREHVVMPDGFHRSSVYYSILAPEWPGVRARLDERLAGARWVAP